MRLLLLPLVLLLTITVTPAQRPEKKEKEKENQQEKEPLALEELRKIANEQVEQMAVEFKKRLSETVPTLRRIPIDRDSERAAALRKELVPWASVFHGEFVSLIEVVKEKHLRGHIAEVLAEANSPKAATGLLGLVGKEGAGLDLLCIRAVGRMADPGDDARAKLVSIAETAESYVLGAVLIAAARTGCKQAAELSRKVVTSSDSVPARARAITALSITADNPRNDVRLIAKYAGKEQDKVIRLAALRAFGRYPGNLDSRRVLHDTLSEDDSDLVGAALDALEKVASKETSKTYLLTLVKSDAELELRERAARILVPLGSVAGARHLVEPRKRYADQNRRNDDAQRTAAMGYYDLGSYEDAITYFERAVRVANATTRYELRVWIAKSRAHLGSFERAAKELKDAGYESFHLFRDESAFAIMMKHPKWAPLFAEKKTSKKR
ncbi:MAG: hypothetical protein CMJ83_21400 [Planctomycetes bacterium]|nr:hypothetical protein [Planctomycetota bacterium]